ncbi:MAG TPA: hypothetical protein DCZ04_02590 [Syntrophorhabdus aromaticivorans]|nr:hypothetical protein [Syntrophorhabdus aromaticivorans]
MGSSRSPQWVPNMLEGATRKKFFLLKTNRDTSCEHGVGVSQANRRETRKLGLLLSGKSSEVERERMQPLERKERVCGDISTQMLIPIKNPGEKYALEHETREKLSRPRQAQR